MEVVPLTVSEAEAFLAKHERHYKAPVTPVCAVGVGDAEGLHGAAVMGKREDGDAELNHIYCDGTSQGYTVLYGAVWRTLKALGYKRTWL